MKKLSWFLFAVAFVIMGLIPLLANAQGGALLIKGEQCTFLDLDDKLFPDVPNVSEAQSIKVLTPSANCNKNVSCHAALSDFSSYQPPAKAVVFDYDYYGGTLLCKVLFELVDDNGNLIFSYWMSTDDWHEVITPKGNVSLTCHFKNCGCEGEEGEACWECCLTNPGAPGCPCPT